jgi:hypothetical protein
VPPHVIAEFVPVVDVARAVVVIRRH